MKTSRGGRRRGRRVSTRVQALVDLRGLERGPQVPEEIDDMSSLKFGLRLVIRYREDATPRTSRHA